MMNNCTVRFYIGLIFHLMGAVALWDYGVRHESAIALVGAGVLALVSALVAIHLRRDARPVKRAHPSPPAREPAAQA